MPDGSQPLDAAANFAREQGLGIIPVTGLDRSTEYQAAAARIHERDRRGLALRLSTEEIDPETISDSIDEFLESASVAAGDVDLIVDEGAVMGGNEALLAQGLRSVIGTFPLLTQWRSITLAGSAFPADTRQVGRDSVVRIPRVEWTIWRSLVERSAGLHRLLHFGDYGVNHPAPSDIDPRIMRMSANLRYTTSDHWLIVKGRSVRDFGFEQMHGICEELCRRPEYCGPNYSWGDQWVEGCATKRERTGNATTWRTVGTSHHLAFALDQLASFP